MRSTKAQRKIIVSMCTLKKVSQKLNQVENALLGKFDQQWVQ